MRVIFVVNGSGGFSGATKQALTLMNTLRNADCSMQFELVSVEPDAAVPSTTKVDGVMVHRIPRKGLRALFYLFRSLKADVIHLHGFFALPLFVALCKGLPVILKTTLVGEDDYRSLGDRRFGGVLLTLARLATVNVVLSNQTAGINKPLALSQRRLHLPNGIALTDPDSFAVLMKSNPQFCCVGLICPRKGTLEAINYFLNNYASCPGSRLIIAGPGPEKPSLPEFDVAYYEKCVALARLAPSQIKFVGNLSAESLREVYRSSLCLLFFSQREGMPNVLLEAMASNCVPISLPLDGLASEVISNQVDGFVIPDAHASAPAITTLFTLKEQVRPLQSARRFDIVSIAAVYRSLYRELSSAAVKTTT